MRSCPFSMAVLTISRTTGHSRFVSSRYRCLVMSETYIRTHYRDILAHACDAEHRISDDCTQEDLLRDNALALEACRKYGAEYILIDGNYEVDF